MFRDSFKIFHQSRRVSDWLISYCLPVGWFVLLTGMFWVGDRSRYHKLYYAFVFFPTVLALVLYPHRLKKLMSCPLVLLFCLFAFYTMLSVLWSGTGESFFSMHSVYILCLLFAASLMEIEGRSGRLEGATAFAAHFAVLAVVVSLAYYFFTNNGGRLSGYGALYNPLLSAHVFGFFCAYWLAHWWLNGNPAAFLPVVATLVLWVAIAFTGSRTPIVALFSCLIWLALLSWKKRFLIVVLAALVIVFLVQSVFQLEDLATRGLSYRPAIWAETIRQIREHIWFGHGYTHPQVFRVEGLGSSCCADPHNIELAVLFTGGIFGLVIWLSMYFSAFVISWRNRTNPAVVVASTLMVFGFVAGLTEGNSFFSRPKEHWFLIWIPMSLLIAAWFRQQRQTEDQDAPT